MYFWYFSSANYKQNTSEIMAAKIVENNGE